MEHMTCSGCVYDVKGTFKCNHPDWGKDDFILIPLKYCYKEKND